LCYILFTLELLFKRSKDYYEKIDCDEKEVDFVFRKLEGTKIVMTDQGNFGSKKFANPYPAFTFLSKLIED